MTKSKWISLGFGLFMIGAAFSLVLWQGTSQDSPNVAFAQAGATATPSAQPTKAPAAQGQATDLASAFWSALASKLGIGVDDLKTKVVAAQKDVIEQAVKDGKLTRAQADAQEQKLGTDVDLDHLFEGPRGAPGGRGKGPEIGGHAGSFGGASTIEAVAAALSMKPADLSAQLQSGKTLADIAKAQNVDQAKVKQAIIDATRAQIQREVQDGLITQAQADSALARLTPDQIDLTRPHGRPGGGRGLH